MLYEGNKYGILNMKSSEFKMSVSRQTNTEPVFWDLSELFYYISTLKTELLTWTYVINNCFM